MECPGCGAEVPEGRFCIACGTPLPRRCPACAGIVPPQAGFCPRCGERLEAAAPPKRPEPAPSEAERRQLTILFCDLVGSTALVGRLDPEDMGEVIRAYRAAVSSEITRFEGHVAKFMGDGVLAYFGYPKAHEDDAERAVRSGLAVVAAVARLVPPGREPLAVRVGIATGLVVVGQLVGEGAAQEQEQSVIGETPNLAARLQAVAEPGSVVIGETTRRLLGGLFEIADLGPQPLKGFAAPVQAYRVVGMGAAESRFEALHAAALTPLVGRERELRLLLDRWGRAKAGEGQVVLLTGEPGIGKSRLARALQEHLVAEPHTCLRYFCSPYHVNSVLFPVIDQLERAARLRPDDPPGAALDKLEALLARAGVAYAAPLLAALLGLEAGDRYGPLDLTPEVQRARTFAALVDHLLGLAAEQPVLVLVEDAHWIDPTTRELILEYLDCIADRRILILLTTRADRLPELPAGLRLTRLALGRLQRPCIETIIGRLCPKAPLPDEVIDLIVARTDGIPLFVEEFTKWVLESDDTAIPASLHDSLMARLDHQPEVKGIAQTAACLGREFDFRLLAAVTGRPDRDLQVALDKLVLSGLVIRHGDPPHALYSFKHALVRDAAYESLLRSRRRQLHTRIVEVLESRAFPGSSAELLAHHASRAGLTGRAIDYWQQAGEAALAKSAYREAVAHLSSAIELIAASGDEQRERELALQVQLGQALIASAGYGDTATKRAFDRARELLDELPHSELRVSVLYGSWVGHYVRAESELSLVRAKEFLAVAETEPGDAARLIAHRVAGTSYVLLGELSAGRQHLETSLSIYDPERHRALSPLVGVEPGVSACCYLAWTMWLLGFPEQASALLERAADLGRDSRRINARAYLHFHSGLPAMCWRDPAMVEHHGRRLAELASKHRLLMWQGLATTLMAWVAMELGRPQEAVAGYERGLAALASTGTRLFVPFMASGLARSLAACGRVDEAGRVIETAIADNDATAQHWCAAELWRVRGELCLAPTRDDGAEAERSFERALAIARAQGARSWELRAATSLARLWAERGERRKARDLLAPVYGWFTEGYETADLKDARALLDELT